MDFYLQDSAGNKFGLFTHHSDDGKTGSWLDYVFFSGLYGRYFKYSQEKVGFSDHVCLLVGLEIKGLSFGRGSWKLNTSGEG